MPDGAQVFEKNHFLAQWNQSTVTVMEPVRTTSARLVLTLMAAALALATLAPVVVLAG
jgi:hypothetical protein